MTSNRPTNENQLDLFCTEETCAGSAAELQTEQSASAVVEKPALDNVPIDLMEQIVDQENMEIAWAKVRANRGAPGPDGITLAEFPEHFRASWPDIEQQLLEGTYQPGPARRKSIPKEDGRTRPLGISCLEDKIVQEMARRTLETIYEPLFIETSYGFRPKRSCHDALRQVNHEIMSERVNWIADLDLAQFFDPAS